MSEEKENYIPDSETEDTKTFVDESLDTVQEAFTDVPSDAAPKLPVARQLTLLGALLFGVFAIGALPFFASHLNILRNSQPASPVESETENVASTDDSQRGFANISITAESAIVIDISTGQILYEKSADKKLPLASITKLMTALLAHEISEDGLVVPIDNDALSQSGDGGLEEGDRFTLSKLIGFVLPTSSNDGAYALAASAGRALDTDSPAEAFVEAMNIRAKELGLTSTSFRNPTGLDLTEDEAGAYGSARDVAKLLEYIVKNEPSLLEETTKSKAVYNDINGGSHSANNTNPVVNAIPGLIGSKTGYTTLSGGNLAIAWNVGADHPVVAVVLASTHSGRFTDVLRLVDATKSTLDTDQ